jgi:hypothetical protein
MGTWSKGEAIVDHFPGSPQIAPKKEAGSLL